MNTALCYDIYSANCTVNIPSLVPRATAYASTGDNRYNCAPHREGYHFQDIEVFLQAGNDVIATSPLGGTASNSSLRILIERPRLYNSV